MEIPCSVSATPAVTSVQWQFTSNSGNTITITQSTSKYTVGSNTTAPNLTVNSAALSDAGSYACSATNIVGTGSDTATLTITGSKSQCGDVHNIGFLWSAQCFFFLGKQEIPCNLFFSCTKMHCYYRYLFLHITNCILVIKDSSMYK